AEARLREVEPQRGDRPTVGLAGIGAAIGVAAGATTLGMVAGQSEEDSERPEPDTSSVGAVPTPVPDILTAATSDAVDLAASIASENAGSAGGGDDEDDRVAAGSVSIPPAGSGGSGSDRPRRPGGGGGSFPLDLDEKIALGVAFIGLGSLVAWGVTGERPMSGVLDMVQTASEEALVVPSVFVDEAEALAALPEADGDRDSQAMVSLPQATPISPTEQIVEPPSPGRIRTAAGVLAAARARAAEADPNVGDVLPEVDDPETDNGEAVDTPVAIEEGSEAVPPVESVSPSEDTETPSLVEEAESEGGEIVDESAESPEVEAPEAEAPEEIAALPLASFEDVTPEYWAFPFIEALREEGFIAEPSGSGKFAPDEPVTRAELAAKIREALVPDSARQSGEGEASAFPDIPEDFEGAGAIDGAIASGFMSGYSEGVFRPDQLVPRHQVLVSLASGLDLPSADNPEAILAQFADGDRLPDWAKAQVAGAVEAGLVVNYPTTTQLQPEKSATRAEVAAMVHQALVHRGETASVSSEYIVSP
ncbi:MAG: S-layer homology domain-containing protein, partial [Cyanobacteria bacterium P01_F01_bin.33]